MENIKKGVKTYGVTGKVNREDEEGNIIICVSFLENMETKTLEFLEGETINGDYTLI